MSVSNFIISYEFTQTHLLHRPGINNKQHWIESSLFTPRLEQILNKLSVYQKLIKYFCGIKPNSWNQMTSHMNSQNVLLLRMISWGSTGKIVGMWVLECICVEVIPYSIYLSTYFIVTCTTHGTVPCLNPWLVISYCHVLPLFVHNKWMCNKFQDMDLHH